MPSETLEKSSKIVLKKLNIMEQNNSQAELVRQNHDGTRGGGGGGGGVVGEDENEQSWRDVRWKEWIAVIVLCYVNLINYMDRFTVAGVLTDIQKEFNSGNDKGGLLQTAFIVTYMAFGPLFGYLGDRYSRKWLMAIGVSLWSLTTLIGSFMTNYWWFLLFRAMVGIGEASYSTIAPTIVSDLFVGNMRSKMLALFYFAIPVGSGLGYIIGSETAKLFGSWHWALRVTPVLGLIAVIAIILLLKEPERGASEGSGHMETTSWCEDLKHIVKNKSFMFSTAGFTCVAFVAGALSWWGPKYVEIGSILQGNGEGEDTISLKFGIVAMISGLLGVPAGSALAQGLRHRWRRIDAYICGGGLLLSCPFVFAAIFMARYSTDACFALVFFGEFFLNLTWAIVADILLYVIVPIRRSTAEGFQLLVSHALGDAGSPYLVGVLSDAFAIMLRKDTTNSGISTNGFNATLASTTPLTSSLLSSSAAAAALSTAPLPDDISFRSLQYALFITCFVEILGGLFFLINAFYLVEDRERAERAVHADSLPSALSRNGQPELPKLDPMDQNVANL